MRLRILDDCRLWSDYKGRIHRIDGPAIEYYNGGRLYYLEGYRYCYSEWRDKINKYRISKDV